MNKNTINKENLYNCISCALTHDIEVCLQCKKCNENGIKGRINMIANLAVLLDVQVPWCDEKDKSHE